MSHRILIAEMKQETSTFNPAPTRLADFRVLRGQDMLDHFKGTKTELSGFIDTISKQPVELLPTLSADAVSGGRIADTALDGIINEIVDLARATESADAIYLCLHGAMAGESEDDPEGLLIHRIRELFPDTPIVVSLDLHAILSTRMVESADILVPFHTYPHIDQYQTGERAAACLWQMLEGNVKPITTRVPIPLLVRGDELITATGLFGIAIEICEAIEQDPRGLAAGVIIGNAFTDVPALQSYVLISTDDEADYAHHEAKRLAAFMWEHRERLQADLTSLPDAIEIARRDEGLTIFSDAADATASGASGDSNCILQGLLECGYNGKALIPIVDGPAVVEALEAGIGAEIEITLGGQRDSGRFTPLRVTAVVKSLHDGNFHYEDGTRGSAGRTAVLIINDSITVVATERSAYFVGRKIFEAHGADTQDFDLLVIKSPNGFRAHYEAIASAIVPVDVPGSTSANLLSLPFENCVRPIFPLDTDLEPEFQIEDYPKR